MITCGDCGHEIWWGATVDGKAMPLDPRSTDTGNVILTGRRGRAKGRDLPEVKVLTDADRERLGDELENMARYVPHFATCRERASSPSGPSDEEPKTEAAPTSVASALVGAKGAKALADASASGAAKVRTGTQHAAVLVDLLGSSAGLSAYELTLEGTKLHECNPRMSVNNAGARLGELRDRGLVEIALDPAGLPVTRPAAAGVSVVHVLTTDGREKAKGLT